MDSFIQPCMKLLTRPESNLPDKTHTYIYIPTPTLVPEVFFFLVLSGLVAFLGYASFVPKLEVDGQNKPLGPLVESTLA